MIIQVSEKHAVGEYGKEVSDKEIKSESIQKCSYEYWHDYIVIGGYSKNEVCYIEISENKVAFLPPYSCCKAFKKNTVITFIQDKLS